MALTIKVPPPLERQVTETKWTVAEGSLRATPALETSTALLTPRHIYAVVRAPDGSLSRTRTKSHEEPNVDLAPSPRPCCVPGVLVDNASHGAPAGV